jgi:hypothetical protein
LQSGESDISTSVPFKEVFDGFNVRIAIPIDVGVSNLETPNGRSTDLKVDAAMVTEHRTTS